MPLLAEYAITPDVLDVTSYETEGECGARLERIRETMLNEGLVRDLRDGAWRKLFVSDDRSWHPRGRELVKKLAQQGRLVNYPPVLAESPLDDRGWCAEAVRTHHARPFTGGIIATKNVKDAYADQALVARIDRLGSASWWAARSPSVRLDRTQAEYETHLDPLLRCSNSLMFIDPHLDPGATRYDGFGALLRAAGGRTPPPTIELHRVCYEGSGIGRRFPEREQSGYFERRFRDVLGEPLRAAGLGATVFIWNDFHDRYLISNLIGLSLPNGFDTGCGATTWARLGRNERDDVQREFDRASRRHRLAIPCFSVP